MLLVEHAMESFRMPATTMMDIWKVRLIMHASLPNSSLV